MAIRIVFSLFISIASGLACASGMIQATLSEVLLHDVTGSRIHLRTSSSGIECVEVLLSRVDVYFDCGWLDGIKDPDLQKTGILSQFHEGTWFHRLIVPFFGFGEDQDGAFEFVADWRGSWAACEMYSRRMQLNELGRRIQVRTALPIGGELSFKAQRRAFDVDHPLPRSGKAAGTQRPATRPPLTSAHDPRTAWPCGRSAGC